MVAAAVGGLAIVLHCLELLHFVVVDLELRRCLQPRNSPEVVEQLQPSWPLDVPKM